MTMRDILVEDYNDDSEDFLVHYGILGMKWGVRRYQNEDGSYTRAGEMRRRKSFRLETKEEKAERLAKKNIKKAVRQVKKAEQAAKREEKREQRSAEDQARLEKKKFQILRSGDADRIYKNQHLFTDQELNTALNRLRQNEQVRQMGKGYQKEQERSRKESQKQSDKQKQNQQAKQQTKNGKDIVDRVISTGTKINNAYATYNLVAAAVNSISGKDTLPNFKDTSFSNWRKSKNRNDLTNYTSDEINAAFDAAVSSSSSTSVRARRMDASTTFNWNPSSTQTSNNYNWVSSMESTNIDDVLRSYS